MTPRPYQLGRRQAAADQTRARILRAARQLLTARGGNVRFSLDAVAARAGVARMTVYYQFGSKRLLIEALFDDFAVGGELPDRIAAAFAQSDPDVAVAEVVAAFARFWEGGRRWVRRVRALGVLDPELGKAIEGRNSRRRDVVRSLLERFPRRRGRPAVDRHAELEDILYTLTSFETFDTLAGPRRSLEDAAPAVLRLARAAIGAAE